MKNLYYSTADKILFHIIGYAQSDCGNVAGKQIEFLQKQLEDFVNMCISFGFEPELKEIRTDEIRKSQRFLYMRVYYVPTETIPQEAFVTNNKMWEILSF